MEGHSAVRVKAFRVFTLGPINLTFCQWPEGEKLQNTEKVSFRQLSAVPPDGQQQGHVSKRGVQCHAEEAAVGNDVRRLHEDTDVLVDVKKHIANVSTLDLRTAGMLYNPGE